MSELLVTRRPEKQFAPSVKLSRWTALANPYLFELTRTDFGIVSTGIRPAYHPTLPTVRTNGDPAFVPLFIAPGNRVYINSGMYNGIYTVFSVSGEYVTINTPYIGFGGAGRLNIIERILNYKVNVRVFDAVTDLLIDELFLSPDGTGFLLADVSGVLRSKVVTTADVNQTIINRANKGISGSFRISYGATWRFFDGNIDVDVVYPEKKVSGVYYWASAARQVTGNTSAGMAGIGQNLKEYVPKNLAASEAKFLTMFERPTFFQGFPFFLSFIYDEDFEGITLKRHQQDKDINGVDVGSETSNTLLVTERKYVNNMRLRAPNAGTKVITAWLETGPPDTNGYVEAGGIEVGASSPNAAKYEGG
jgi:hypothetical protein